MSEPSGPLTGWRGQLNNVIFGHDTPAGQRFDVVLIWMILGSVAAVMVDTVRSIHDSYGNLLLGLEWTFTIFFTIEYALRLSCSDRPLRYAVSFFGLVDLLSVIPTYLSLFIPGTQYLLVIRVLRVLRVFRVLKLVEYLGESEMIMAALRDSRKKITVFLFAVLALAVVLGSFMYILEGPTNGFTSIPASIYWTIVTLTTVGYGDIAPRTPMGQSFAAIVMMLGYAIIAVPTGIVTVALSRRGQSSRICPTCEQPGHDPDARHCKHCGSALVVL